MESWYFYYYLSIFITTTTIIIINITLSIYLLTNYSFILHNRRVECFVREVRGRGRESQFEWGGGWIEG